MFSLAQKTAGTSALECIVPPMLKYMNMIYDSNMLYLSLVFGSQSRGRGSTQLSFYGLI